MAKDPDKFDLAKLRNRAMKVLKGKAPKSALQLSESELLKLIHELEVYRIELEMLQDELKRSDENMEEAMRKYEELSDLHNNFILHMIKGHKYPGSENDKE